MFKLRKNILIRIKNKEIIILKKEPKLKQGVKINNKGKIEIIKIMIFLI